MNFITGDIDDCINGNDNRSDIDGDSNNNNRIANTIDNDQQKIKIMKNNGNIKFS